MGVDNKLTCMVVDDESIARKGLMEQLSQHKALQVVAEAATVNQFLEKVTQVQPDVVFLDIMLRNQNVLDYFEQIERKPHVVFVSAYREFAVEGFELNVTDYLLKPVTDERLEQCVAKLSSIEQFQNTPKDVVFLKSNKQLFRLKVQDILYCKSMENYVQVFLKNKRLVCKLTLAALKERLKGHQFVHAHRSYLVNADKIESVSKLEIIIGEARIPISRDNKHAVYAEIFGMKSRVD